MVPENLFDVLAVRIDDSTVRFMAQGRTERNAEAILNMAVARRGSDVEFYTIVPQNLYHEGSKYNGGGRA